MPLAVTVQQVQQLLDDTPFTRDLGLVIHSLGDGECILDIPFQPSFERPDRLINGGVYMIAADVSMWIAIMTRLGIDKRTVTANMQTAFLNSAIEQDVRCTARVWKVGRRLIYGDADCATLDGKRLTHHTMTYIRL